MTYVALIADDSGRYCHVYGTADTWHNYVDQLEELGCEVVENQTDDYDIEELGTIDNELSVVPITKLLTSTDFIPCQMTERENFYKWMETRPLINYEMTELTSDSITYKFQFQFNSVNSNLVVDVLNHPEE
jgi:hypothetical protein